MVETTGPAEIRRSDGSRNALISANLVGDRDLGSVSKDIEAVLGAARDAARLRLEAGRPAPGDEDVVRLDAARRPARRVHGLPGDGVAVRVAAAPLRHPVQRALRRHRRARHAVGVRRHHQRRGHDRRHHAGRHRRQQRHPADRLHQPAPPAGDGQEGSADRGRSDPAAPDPDDHQRPPCSACCRWRSGWARAASCARRWRSP